MYIKLLMLLVPFITLQAEGYYYKSTQQDQYVVPPCSCQYAESRSFTDKLKDFWYSVKEKARSWWDTVKEFGAKCIDTLKFGQKEKEYKKYKYPKKYSNEIYK